MAFVIAEPCIGTKDASCVDVCPVDCIHPRKDEGNFPALPMLYIDPDTCIDCGYCVTECPVSAIFPKEELKEEWKKYAAINADYYKLSAEDFQAKHGTATPCPPSGESPPPST